PLIGATPGAHRWAEHYDRNLEDVFAVQDEVVRTIVAILAAHVRKAEIERTRAKPPNSWRAYDYYLQAADALTSFEKSANVEDLYETRCLIQQSLAIDANYAPSYAILAYTYDAAWISALDSDFLNPGVLDQAHQFARKAVQLDSNLPLAHASLGLVLTLKHAHDRSIASFDSAIALTAKYVFWQFGAALVLAGNSSRAIKVVDAYMRLAPFYAPPGLLGLAHYMLRHYSEALSVLREFVSKVPNFWAGHVW